MRQIDHDAIHVRGISSLTLMENAGRGVFDLIENWYGPVGRKAILVVCGRGNNGGDGLVIARHLLQHHAAARAFIVGEIESLTPDAQHMCRMYKEAGGQVVVIHSEQDLTAASVDMGNPALVIDALLGTGSTGAPRGLIAAAVEYIATLARAGTPVVAVDLPTGVDADKGAIPGVAVPASYTATLALWKRGLLLYPGRTFAGLVEVVDIGMPPESVARAGDLTDLADEAFCRSRVPYRSPTAHKGSVGRVLIVGGSSGMVGAVALAARAAVRMGAGLVTAVVPRSLQDILATKLTEPLTLGVSETPDRALALDAADAILHAAARADVVALGPGCGRAPSTLALIRTLLERLPVPVVLDADGLTVLAAEDAADASSALRSRKAPLVITPHVGEMARITKMDATAIEAQRFDVPAKVAEERNAVVLLKGPPTIVAAPGSRPAAVPTGNPGMATGGTGDVLTGAIAALIGQRLSPFDAAVLGAYLHGRAGDLAAAQRGEIGLAAGDVVEFLPDATLHLARPAHGIHVSSS
jgi:NAD(P)H-hydrate epimerase